MYNKNNKIIIKKTQPKKRPTRPIQIFSVISSQTNVSNYALSLSLSLFTVSSVIYEYQIIIEINTTDADHLRNKLESIVYPTPVSTKMNITEAHITTGMTKIVALREVLCSINSMC